MRMSEQVILTCCQKRTYARHTTRVKIYNAKIAKACFREDNSGNYKHAAGDKRTDGVREDVLEHNA